MSEKTIKLPTPMPTTTPAAMDEPTTYVR